MFKCIFAFNTRSRRMYSSQIDLSSHLPPLLLYPGLLSFSFALLSLFPSSSLSHVKQDHANETFKTQLWRNEVFSPILANSFSKSGNVRNSRCHGRQLHRAARWEVPVPHGTESVLHTYSSSSPMFSFLWKPFWLPCVCIYFLSGSVHDSSAAGRRSKGRAGPPGSSFPRFPALFWAAFWKAVPRWGAVRQAAEINSLCLW